PRARSTEHEHHSYAAQGEYLAPLRAWAHAFGRDRLLVVRSEDLFSRPDEAWAEVLAFLGLRPVALGRAIARNAAPPAPMADATRYQLIERFAPGVADLEGWLGRDLGWLRR